MGEVGFFEDPGSRTRQAAEVKALGRRPFDKSESSRILNQKGGMVDILTRDGRTIVLSEKEAMRRGFLPSAEGKSKEKSN